MRGYRIKRYLRKKNLRKLEALSINIAAVVVIIIAVAVVYTVLKNKSAPVYPTERVAAFQIPHKTVLELSTLAAKYGIDFPELLVIYCFENNFFPAKTTNPEVYEIEQRYILHYDELLNKYDTKVFRSFVGMFRSLLDEQKYFPIAPVSDAYESISYMFGDSWGATRQNGHTEIHQGTDIYDRENIRGRLPIISITDGVVQKFGWDEYDGFYVKVLSLEGNVYYYAHMDSFNQSLKEGSRITAGYLLGHMGDSGYGKAEGTRGHIQVQLHLSISPNNDKVHEVLYINPYPFLRLIEDKKVDMTK